MSFWLISNLVQNCCGSSNVAIRVLWNSTRLEVCLLKKKKFSRKLIFAMGDCSNSKREISRYEVFKETPAKRADYWLLRVVWSTYNKSHISFLSTFRQSQLEPHWAEIFAIFKNSPSATWDQIGSNNSLSLKDYWGKD